MLVSLTVGKVDAGMAVLLTEDKRIIEFPSILLPPDISSGSIVDITVARNLVTEKAAASAFSSLQSTILSSFGARAPTAPALRCRNATQTAVVLEWDPIDLATADLRSLALYRNGAKAGTIPRPTELTATKISGLAVDTEYTFHLVLRTSAGTLSSPKLTVRTHAMTDLHGITVTPGIMPAALRASLLATVERIGASLADTVRIDTTHFVCTEPRGAAWDRAREMNIPIVVPDWVKGCESERRILGVRQYYLDADPKLRQVGPSVVTSTTTTTTTNPHQQQQQQQQGERPRTPPVTPSTKITPPTPEQGPGPNVPPKDLPLRSGRVSDSIAEEHHAAAASDAAMARRLQGRAADASSDEDEDDNNDEHDEEESAYAETSEARVSSDEEEEAATGLARGPRHTQAQVEDARHEEQGFDDVAL